MNHNGMSRDAEEYVWRIKGIAPQLKLLLLVMAREYDYVKGSCSPSVPRLAALSGFSERMVRRHKFQLVANNLIQSDFRASKEGTNVYTITGFDGSNASLKKNDQLMADFDLFWHEYPKKEAKAQAVKTWLKLRPSHEEALKMIIHLEYKCDGDWCKDNRKFIPLPSSYLNGERWKDEQVIDEHAETKKNMHFY